MKSEKMFWLPKELTAPGVEEENFRKESRTDGSSNEEGMKPIYAYRQKDPLALIWDRRGSPAQAADSMCTFLDSGTRTALSLSLTPE